MFITIEDAMRTVDKYGDAAYRFAYILTLSREAAEKTVCLAFEELSEDDTFSEDDENNRRAIFNRIYKYAKRIKNTALSKKDVEAEYGEKCDEFYEIAALPLPKRAEEHLISYEGCTEEEVRAILGKEKI